MPTITIVAGGNSIHSRLTGILNYAEEFLKSNSIDVEIIQVHQLPSEALIKADFKNEKIQEVNQLIEKSDGVIFLTPVYKAAYSGILKTYIDLLPQKALKDKAVLPLALGGTYGHLLVIDYVLKPVLINLGTTNINGGVYIQDTQVTKQDDNTYTLADETILRLNESLSQFVKSIVR
ncbi:NADPH-dependent FMN reductase [Niallia taxi]|uniref:NADPH-dependent FMN reductase n=1 Tax=Niallia taxi TaxID=2499688 RepID=UPI003981B35D